MNDTMPCFTTRSESSCELHGAERTDDVKFSSRGTAQYSHIPTKESRKNNSKSGSELGLFPVKKNKQKNLGLLSP